MNISYNKPDDELGQTFNLAAYCIYPTPKIRCPVYPCVATTHPLDMMDLNGHNSARPLDEKSISSGTRTGLDRILRKSKYKLINIYHHIFGPVNKRWQHRTNTNKTTYSGPCKNGSSIGVSMLRKLLVVYAWPATKNINKEQHIII